MIWKLDSAITQRGYQTNDKDMHWNQNITKRIAHGRLRRKNLVWFIGFPSRSKAMLRYHSLSSFILHMEYPVGTHSQFSRSQDLIIKRGRLKVFLSKIRFVEDLRVSPGIDPHSPPPPCLLCCPSVLVHPSLPGTGAENTLLNTAKHHTHTYCYIELEKKQLN